MTSNSTHSQTIELLGKKKKEQLMFFFLLSPPPGLAWFSRRQVLRWTKTPKRSTRDDSFRRQKKKSGLGRGFGCRPPKRRPVLSSSGLAVTSPMLGH